MTITETKRLDVQELAELNDSSESWHLRALEAEAIHIIREVVAEFDRPGLLFSGGKDSAVLLHLAVKALRPANLPFPVIHIDTGHNFPEAIAFRDRVVERLGIDLVVGSVEEAIASGLIPTPPSPSYSRNRMQTPVLLETIRRGKFTAVFAARGGMRSVHAQRSASTPCGMNSASGTRATNARSSGASTTAALDSASTCASFHSPTGLSWTSGAT